MCVLTVNAFMLLTSTDDSGSTRQASAHLGAAAGSNITSGDLHICSGKLQAVLASDPEDRRSIHVHGPNSLLRW